MTSRENRKQRREAERRARKIANRQPQNAPAPPSPSPAPPQPLSPKAAYIAEIHAKADRELDEEFGAEFMAHAREVSDRMARRFGLPLWSGRSAAVAPPELGPAANIASELPPPQTQQGTENPIPAPRPSTHNPNAPGNSLPAKGPRGHAQQGPASIISTTHPKGHEAPSLTAPEIQSNEAASPNEPKIQNSEFAFLSNSKISNRATGPRTPAGKMASSRNSLKHGLASGTLTIPGEDTAAFEALRDALLHEHQPADSTEHLLVHELAQSYWLQQRAIRFQNECFTAPGSDNKTGLDNKLAVDEKRLALFLRYGTTHERAFHKALNTLLRLKRDRQKAEIAAARAITPGFVSQTTAPKEFVSQNPAASSPKSSPTGFVSQNDALPEPYFVQTTEITSRKSPAELGKLPDAA